MNQNEILQDFASTGALLSGHFQLRSGLHSKQYFQCALVLQHSLVAARLCAELASKWKDVEIDTVIAPAIGGIIVGQEVARSLGVKSIFAEKDENSNLLLRRGFTLKPGEKVLVAEDVVTKGGRVQQTIDLVKAAGAIPVGVAVLVDRSAGDVDFGVPMTALLKLDLETFQPDDCPLCKQGLAIDHPGSK